MDASNLKTLLPQFTQQEIESALIETGGNAILAVSRLLNQPAAPPNASAPQRARRAEATVRKQSRSHSPTGFHRENSGLLALGGSRPSGASRRAGNAPAVARRHSRSLSPGAALTTAPLSHRQHSGLLAVSSLQSPGAPLPAVDVDANSDLAVLEIQQFLPQFRPEEIQEAVIEADGVVSQAVHMLLNRHRRGGIPVEGGDPSKPSVASVAAAKVKRATSAAAMTRRMSRSLSPSMASSRRQGGAQAPAAAPPAGTAKLLRQQPGAPGRAGFANGAAEAESTDPKVFVPPQRRGGGRDAGVGLPGSPLGRPERAGDEPASIPSSIRRRSVTNKLGHLRSQPDLAMPADLDIIDMCLSGGAPGADEPSAASARTRTLRKAAKALRSAVPPAPPEEEPEAELDRGPPSAPLRMRQRARTRVQEDAEAKAEMDVPAQQRGGGAAEVGGGARARARRAPESAIRQAVTKPVSKASAASARKSAPNLQAAGTLPAAAAPGGAAVRARTPRRVKDLGGTTLANSPAGGGGGGGNTGPPEVLSVLVACHEDAGKSAIYEGLVRAGSRETESQGRGVSTNELAWAFCSSPKRRFTFIHAPGWRAAIPEFIRGVAQADVAVLGVPAFVPEACIDWWALERAAIAQALGISRIIFAVVLSGEEDSAEEEGSFRDTISQLQPQLEECGIAGAVFLPVHVTTIAALGGPGMASAIEVVSRLGHRDNVLGWWNGESLLKVLENVHDVPSRAGGQLPLRVLILGKHQEGAGVSLIGRVVQGSVHDHTECLLRPGWRRLLVQSIRDPHSDNEGSCSCACAGDYVDLQVSPVSDHAAANRSADASAGPQPLCLSGHKSAALWGASAGESQRWLVELRVLELEELDQPKVGRGFYGMLYFGAEAVGTEIVELIEAIDLVTQLRSNLPAAALPGTLTQCIVKLRRSTVLDTFTGGQLGRFVLRRAGHTVGVGKVVAAAVAPR
uniref:CUE domain-containing protein n=1 Tax=Alexandrium monilatum TaxID=311494 RepID=A0A7S4SQ65_9DINO